MVVKMYKVNDFTSDIRFLISYAIRGYFTNNHELLFVVLLLYFDGKQLRSCRDGQLI